MKDRFKVVYKETHSAGLEKRIIYVDKETGVNYLYVLIGLTQQTDKLEFAEERTAPEQRVI